MASGQRQKRLADNIARVVAEVLQTGLKTPLPGVVTVTGAKLARDLESARIYYTVLGSRSQVQQRLERVAGFVQGEVGRQLRLRVTPALTFEFDEQAEQGTRLLRLLSELKRHDEERDSE